ncbi:MAG: PD-(D/E)XK nuclease family transposase [Rikenellaceae bacterium]
MSYLSCQTYFTFKNVFGSDKGVILHFLNSILPLGNDKIVKLDYLNYFQSPKIPFEQCNVINVSCRSFTSREFTVEINILWSHIDELPVLVDFSSAQITDTNRKYSYKIPHFSLMLVNRAINNQLDGYYHHFSCVGVVGSDEIIENMELIYIELEKFTFFDYNSEQKDDIQLLWLRFLSDIENFVVESRNIIWEIPEFKRSTVRLVSGRYDKNHKKEYYEIWHSLIVENCYDFEFVRNSDAVRKIKLENIKEMAAAIRRSSFLEERRLRSLEKKRAIRCMAANSSY